jgi:hypothetical protein
MQEGPGARGGDARGGGGCEKVLTGSAAQGLRPCNPGRNKRGRIGWTRLRGGCGGAWVHDASGAEVHHCGHPTANWPYCGVLPGDEKMVLGENGRGFQLLELAQRAVEARVSYPWLVIAVLEIDGTVRLSDGVVISTELKGGC